MVAREKSEFLSEVLLSAPAAIFAFVRRRQNERVCSGASKRNMFDWFYCYFYLSIY